MKEAGGSECGGERKGWKKQSGGLGVKKNTDSCSLPLLIPWVVALARVQRKAILRVPRADCAAHLQIGGRLRDRLKVVTKFTKFADADNPTPIISMSSEGMDPVPPSLFN